MADGQQQVQHEEPDYPSAAHAWLSQQMTIAALRHNRECIGIAAEFEQRLRAEQNQESKP